MAFWNRKKEYKPEPELKLDPQPLIDALVQAVPLNVEDTKVVYFDVSNIEDSDMRLEADIRVYLCNSKVVHVSLSPYLEKMRTRDIIMLADLSDDEDVTTLELYKKYTDNEIVRNLIALSDIEALRRLQDCEVLRADYSWDLDVAPELLEQDAPVAISVKSLKETLKKQTNNLEHKIDRACAGGKQTDVLELGNVAYTGDSPVESFIVNKIIEGNATVSDLYLQFETSLVEPILDTIVSLRNQGVISYGELADSSEDELLGSMVYDDTTDTIDEYTEIPYVNDTEKHDSDDLVDYNETALFNSFKENIPVVTGDTVDTTDYVHIENTALKNMVESNDVHEKSIEFINAQNELVELSTNTIEQNDSIPKITEEDGILMPNQDKDATYYTMYGYQHFVVSDNNTPIYNKVAKKHGLL